MRLDSGRIVGNVAGNTERQPEMQTKWANKTAAVIRSGTIPEGIINSMRRIMSRAINNGMYRHFPGTPSCSYDDAGELLELVAEHNPSVTDEQARKGADWLYSQAFTARGAVRRTAMADQFTDVDLAIIKACKENPRFDLVELYDTTQDGTRYCTLFPVYRCHGDHGQFFDYVARAWQSGGNSFVINRGGTR